MAYTDTTPAWHCNHTTHVMRCAKCGLIFCGVCHRVLTSEDLSNLGAFTPTCPDCGEMVLVDISPRRRALEYLRHPAAGYHRAEI